MSKKVALLLWLKRVILTVILIFILISIGFLGWQFLELQKTQRQAKLEFTQQLTDIKTNQADWQHFAKFKSCNATDWVLLEVEYLLRLADISLNANTDPVSAIKLLQAADKRLAILNDPSLTAVRQALATDISTLQTAPRVDTLGIILRINSLNDQIAQLPVIPKLPPQNNKVHELQLQSPSKQTFWQRFWQTTLLNLQKIIIIQRHDQPIQPIFTKEERIYLLERIQLALLKANWAVLNSQPKVYVDSLQEASSLLSVYLEHNLLVVNDIQQSLHELQTINIKPVLPKISAIDVLQQKLHGRATS